MFQHTNKLFLALIFLSALTYFERPDYNLPLFGFAILLWNYKSSQKQRLWYLMTFSVFTDVVWIIYWAVVWNSFDNRQIGICTFTIIISVIELVVKIVTVGILFVKEPQCKSALTDLPNNIKSIFKSANHLNQDQNH